MTKRVFLAINLPENIKDKIEKVVEKIRYQFTQDVRFLSRENWHITITFLGDQDDKFLLPILESANRAAAVFNQSHIRLSGVDYGPIGKAPRMVWLNCDAETSKILSPFKRDLETQLIKSGVIFKREHRLMSAHITLARFNALENLPDIKTVFEAGFQAQSLDLMESRVTSRGSSYEIMQRIYFTQIDS